MAPKMASETTSIISQGIQNRTTMFEDKWVNSKPQFQTFHKNSMQINIFLFKNESPMPEKYIQAFKTRFFEDIRKFLLFT